MQVSCILWSHAPEATLGRAQKVVLSYDLLTVNKPRVSACLPCALTLSYSRGSAMYNNLCCLDFPIIAVINCMLRAYRDPKCARNELETTISGLLLRIGEAHWRAILKVPFNNNKIQYTSRQYHETGMHCNGQLLPHAFHECDHSGLRFSANAAIPSF